MGRQMDFERIKWFFFLQIARTVFVIVLSCLTGKRQFHLK